MGGLSYKRRKSVNSTKNHEDYWKSFTDVFATVCLMFFFVMLIFGVMSSFLGSRARALQEDLELRELALAFALMDLDDVEQERMRLMEEFLRQQDELEAMRIALDLETMRRLGRMQEARADFDEIALYRMAMLWRIAELLRPVLGDNVYVDEEAGALVIGAEILFDSGVATVRPGDVDTLMQMRTILFQIIDDYTESDSLVAFSHFEIRGHTDMVGSGSFNRALATNRANSIINLILPNDSPEEARYGRYFLSGGASLFHPIAGTITEQTPEQMAANRRVEIIPHFDDRQIEAAIAEIANTLLLEEAFLDGVGEIDLDTPVVPAFPFGLDSN